MNAVDNTVETPALNLNDAGDSQQAAGVTGVMEAPAPGAVVPAQGELPNIPKATEAEIAAAIAAEKAKVEATKNAGLVRFQSAFKLEGELVGYTKPKASKKGAVTLGLLPLKSKDGESLASLSAAANGGVEMKGEQLKAFARMKGDAFKVEQVAAVSRIAGDLNFTGGQVRRSASGDMTFVFKKVEPVAVSLTPKVKELTEAEILEKAGQILARKAEEAKKAQALADEAELKRMEEEEKLRKSAESNGEVTKVVGPSDNDGHAE